MTEVRFLGGLVGTIPTPRDLARCFGCLRHADTSKLLLAPGPLKIRLVLRLRRSLRSNTVGWNWGASRLARRRLRWNCSVRLGDLIDARVENTGFELFGDFTFLMICGRFSGEVFNRDFDYFFLASPGQS